MKATIKHGNFKKQFLIKEIENNTTDKQFVKLINKIIVNYVNQINEKQNVKYGYYYNYNFDNDNNTVIVDYGSYSDFVYIYIDKLDTTIQEFINGNMDQGGNIYEDN